MENQKFASNIKVNTNHSTLKKSQQWFWLKWKKLLKLIWLSQFNTQSSLFQLISMILKDKPQKMPVLFQDLMF